MLVNAPRIFALLAMIIGFASPSAAALSTLKFEARVNSRYGVWAATAHRPAPPIDVQIGDLITGSITFDSAVALTSSNDPTQLHSIQLTVEGVNLTTDRFAAYVMNERRQEHVICDCAYVGPVAPDPLILLGHQLANPSLPVLDDRIELTRYVGVPHDVVDFLPSHPDWLWQPTFSLTGPTSVLNRDDVLPSDSATWNAFDQKTLLFGLAHLVHVETSGQSYFEPLVAYASITSFTIAPEPTSAVLIAVAALTLARIRTRRERRRKV